MTSPSDRQRGSRGFVIWLGVGLLAATITAITSFLLGSSFQAPMAPAKVTPHDANREPSPEDRVLLARRDGIRGLDAFIEHQRRLVAESSEPDATGYALTILAMALGERCSARNAGRGIQVGRPLYEQVPEPTERDITEGLNALDRAQELGFESSELHRIRSLLLSCRVVGLTSALRWKGQIGRELQRAFELDPNNPRGARRPRRDRDPHPGLLGSGLYQRAEPADPGGRSSTARRTPAHLRGDGSVPARETRPIPRSVGSGD